MLGQQIKERLGDHHVLLDHRLTYVTQDHDGWTGTFETAHGKTKVIAQICPRLAFYEWLLKRLNARRYY